MPRPADSRAATPEPGAGPDPASVASLLAIRPGGLGDVVRSIPALRLLRASFPVASISVATSSAGRSLLATCPYVDRTMALERPSEARLERFDVALSFADPTARTTLDVADVNARLRVSWRMSPVPERSTIHPVWPARLDACSRMLRLVWLLGGSADVDPGMGLWPSLAERNAAAQLVVGIDRPLCVVHPGAGTARRRWPAERWARVLDMVEGIGLEPVIVGVRGEQTCVDEIAATARHAPISLVGRTGVGELVGLLERAALFLGSDSGPAALAGAVGVQSVIVGPGSRTEHEPRPGLVDIVGAGPCARCGEHACSHQLPSAVEVPLEAVLARVELVAATAVQRWRASRIT